MNLKAGDQLPDFRYVDREGNQKVSSQLRGEIVLIDFWATWCSPCVGLLPEMEKLHKKFEEKDGFSLLGLNLDNDLDVAKAFLSKRKLSWEQGFFANSKAALSSLRISGVPHYCLVNADGTILEWGSDLAVLCFASAREKSNPHLVR